MMQAIQAIQEQGKRIEEKVENIQQMMKNEERILTKKAIKTQILQSSRDEPLKYKDKETVVLKQVPRKVREIREYQFLTEYLIKKGVNDRWLFPEDLMFTWQEQRHRIDSVEKAELFNGEYFRGKEDEKLREEETIKIQEEMVETRDKIIQE
uniref:L1 transposable element RRM domain-containing protein n=1 Tax=Micrurus spixii TaxID=129469 RepID=A0A2D4LGQ0_9SAUR